MDFWKIYTRIPYMQTAKDHTSDLWLFCPFSITSGAAHLYGISFVAVTNVDTSRDMPKSEIYVHVIYNETEVCVQRGAYLHSPSTVD